MRLSILLASSAFVFAVPAMAQNAAPQRDAQPSDAARSDTTSSDNDDFHTTNDDLIVTAPFVRSLDLFGNVGVVQGDDLARDMRGQIGDTLARQPGVSATSFSPGASRPVLRGFQGERVRVLTDGLGSIDASNTSADHAVAIDPLTAERIEILRGPASLLFGSSAIGGAVNIFDRRIPRSVPEAPAHIDALANYGSAANERSGGASIDVPLSSIVALHLDGSMARTDDVRIGGFQSTPALRLAAATLAADALADGDAALADEITASANHRGTLENSATRTNAAGAGIAVINDGGSLGVSIGYYDTLYGIPNPPGGESGVNIDLKQWRADMRGEVQLGEGFLDRLRVRAGFADYTHAEVVGSETGTVFTNQGIEARAELVQNDHGGWSGASGVQYMFRDFNAVGDEAFIPQNDTEQMALFTMQEVQAGAVSFELAGRYEHVRIDARSVAISRSYDAFSGAAGVSYEFGDNDKIGVNLSRTSRAPSAEELLSDGAHVATQSYERGDADFGLESAWSVEGFVRLRSGAVNIELSGFSSWFDNFIYAADTGLIEDGFPLLLYRQADARYYGAEVQASAPIAHFGDFSLNADLAGDVVRAKLANGGGNIPRIPPLRLRGGLELESESLTLRGEAEWTADQNRTATIESATPGFTLVNASAEWKPLGRSAGLSIILSANNIFDVDARRHASFTKEFAPLSGRDFRVTARVSF